MRHGQGTAADSAGAVPPEETSDKGESSNAFARLTTTHKVLIGIVAAGAIVIAAIGFAGSYTAVRQLAHSKGFGWFSFVFPIGVDAGIVVLLALDLLLTWLRIPFPLLRQVAWLLTVATIAFNAAAAWPDPLGVGMHAVIPILFVVCVEAARHAVGRIADVTADKHMESVRLTRWLLAPFPTFKLWRRMKLWEIRSYDGILRLEQDRLIYSAYLESQYGPRWRRKAPVEALMPLRLVRYGVPLIETVPAAMEAVGKDVPALFRARQAAALLPAAAAPVVEPEPDPVADLDPEPAPDVEPEVEPEHIAVEQAPEPMLLSPADCFTAFSQFVIQHGMYPNEEQLAGTLLQWYGATIPFDLKQLQRQYQQIAGYQAPDVTASVPAPEPVAQDHQYAPVVSEPAPQRAPETASVVEVQESHAAPEHRSLDREPVSAPARSTERARVQAKVEDGDQALRPGRGASTREQVLALYRALTPEERALRGRPLAALLAERSGGTLKFDTIRRTHLDPVIAAYEAEQSGGFPSQREDSAVSEREVSQ